MRFISDALLSPLLWVAALVAFHYGARGRWPKLARFAPLVAVTILVVLGEPGVANSLMRGLEEPVLTTMRPNVTYDVVVVLGGTMNGSVTHDRGSAAYNESVERMLTAFDLARANRVKNVLFTGTSWGDAPTEPEPEARILARQIEAWGIDPARVTTEETSRTTHENALESAKLLKAHGWQSVLLVTSAAHMKRARGCFAKEGVKADTLAVDFESVDPSQHRLGILPTARALSQSAAAIHEYAGRVTYSVRGWSE